MLFRRERLRQLRLQALEEACRQLVAGRRPAEAVAAGRAAVEAAPLRESARRALMRAHAAAGRNGDAAAEYEDYRRELHARLALAPSAAMEKLVAAPGLILPSRRGDAVVTDPR